MKITTFEDAKVGDKVWCMRSGWGEIRDTRPSDRCPIYVCFPNGEFKTYTAGGFYDEDDATRSLFWDEVVIEAPVKPLLDLVSAGEPMKFCEDTVLSLAERTFSTEVDEQLAEDVIQYARRLHDMYSTPQSAKG